VSDKSAEQRIDEALDRVLRASGSRLGNYTMHSTLKAMRDEMRAVMTASYIAGSNDCYKAMKGDKL
jgi:hypothetical protein